jgi:hypothetical protein
MKKYTDKQLLDWLEKQEGLGLISDDAGRWAISGSGFQNNPNRKKSIDIASSFFVEADDWRKSIREAVTVAIEEIKKLPLPIR